MSLTLVFNFCEYNPIIMICTYHLTFFIWLLNPEEWQDIKAVNQTVNITLAICDHV